MEKHQAYQCQPAGVCTPSKVVLSWGDPLSTAVEQAAGPGSWAASTTPSQQTPSPTPSRVGTAIQVSTTLQNTPTGWTKVRRKSACRRCQKPNSLTDISVHTPYTDFSVAMRTESYTPSRLTTTDQTLFMSIGPLPASCSSLGTPHPTDLRSREKSPYSTTFFCNPSIPCKDNSLLPTYLKELHRPFWTSTILIIKETSHFSRSTTNGIPLCLNVWYPSTPLPNHAWLYPVWFMHVCSSSQPL